MIHICNNKRLSDTDPFFADIIQINHHHNNNNIVKKELSQAHSYASIETLPFPNGNNIDAAGNSLSAEFASPTSSFGH